MNIKFMLTGLLLLSPMHQLSAAAVPVSDYLIDLRQQSSRVSEGNLESLYYEKSLVATNASYSLTPEVYGYGDLRTGNIGVRAESINEGETLDILSSSVSIFDTVTFSESATVSFNFTVTGSFSAINPSVAQTLQSVSRIGIFDLTGTSQWIFGLEGNAYPVCFTPDCAIFQRSVNSNMDWSRTVDENNGVLAEVTHNFPQDGGNYGLSIDVPGAMNVEAGTTYGIALSMNAIAPGWSINSADFSSTVSFSFTDLDGATFTSGSGAFLTAVPVPASLWLFVSGILSVFGLRAVPLPAAISLFGSALVGAGFAGRRKPEA